MADLVTVADWARGLGISRQAGHQAVQRCNIPLFEGKVDPGVATVLYQQRTRARVKATAPAPAPAAAAGLGASAPLPPSSPIEGSGYDDHKRRQAKADAERAELEVGKLAGRLIDREQAERATVEAFRSLRDAVFSAIKTQARRVVGLVEVREIEQVLEDEARATFASWDQRMANLHKPDAP